MKLLLENWRKYIKEESGKDMYALVRVFREKMEAEWDWENDKLCFSGQCSSVTRELVEHLKQNGIDAMRVNGEYMEPSEDYEPDMSGWDQEDIDQYEEDKEYGDIPPANHWWVEAQGKIIDLTAEQFHPDEEDDYRIVIVDTSDSGYSASGSPKSSGIREAIKLDIEVGDILLGGRYKNKRIVVKEIGADDLGQPTVNGKPVLKFRIEKNLPDEKKSKKTLEAEKNGI